MGPFYLTFWHCNFFSLWNAGKHINTRPFETRSENKLPFVKYLGRTYTLNRTREATTYWPKLSPHSFPGAEEQTER